MVNNPVDIPALTQAARHLLDGIGFKKQILPEGLVDTPVRFATAWTQWTRGYQQDASYILKTFPSEDYDEMVLVRNIPIYSKCEHHLADIFGRAAIGYIPDGRIVGLSKLSRLANMHARRLQVQERMTNDIARDLWEQLAPKGVGVAIQARHMCMESRGVQQPGTITTTSKLLGVFRDKPETRAEFLRLGLSDQEV